jgi:alpha,alpha-trehalase
MQAELAAAEIEERRAGRHLLLLLDFDGTLAPFNPDPGAVHLDAGTAGLLKRIAAQPIATIGVISGRRLPDLQKRLTFSGDMYLAGFHGLEIHAPGEAFIHPEAAAATSLMHSIATAVQPHLSTLPGVFIEDKVFSIALHYREAAPAARVVATSRFVDAARADLDAGRLRILPGACVVELLPGAAWHKGSALQWIRERVEGIHGPTFTVYVGDDVTDQDAFRAIGPHGLAISASERATGGHYSVDGPEGVKRLLNCLDGPEDNRRA